MKRGGTPTHFFNLPVPAEDVDEIEITYVQNKETILQKYKEDCVIEGRKVSVTLTQTETFDFKDDKNVEIQARVKTKAGKVIPSNILCVNCDRCLSEEEL